MKAPETDPHVKKFENPVEPNPKIKRRTHFFKGMYHLSNSYFLDIFLCHSTSIINKLNKLLTFTSI